MYEKVRLKQPSFEIDRDQYELDIMTRASRGWSVEKIKVAQKQAAKERSDRLAKASW